ncbi:MAG: HlyC/CorC family transporter [Chloroflexi bacterium]|nr:HlyC/CorC family transporter [Chloroflexota bacterium]
MESDSWGELLLVGMLILLNAFFAASEIAVISVRKTRLKQLVEEGNREARIVQRLSENSSRFLATIQVGVTLVGFFTAATAAISLSRPLQQFIALIPLSWVIQISQPLAVGLITLTLAFMMLIFGELVPKALALQHAERISLLVARPLDVLATLASPMVRVLTLATDGVMAIFGGGRRSSLPFVTANEIKTMVDAGEEEGVLAQEEKQMIFSVFDMAETTVREIMVPRIDMFAVDIETSFKEVLEHINKTGHSRIPVYEGNVDNIVGILNAKDLFRHLGALQVSAGLRKIIRPAYFVPESRRVDDLLRDLQRERVHMAIVVDEFGGTAGLVTIEDLLEEIVGEIQDEYDREEPQIERLSEDEAIFDGRVGLHDVNDVLSLDLQGEDYDTIGGLVLTHLGKMPAPGDTVEMEGIAITVLSTLGRRVKKVRVTKLAREEGEGRREEDEGN